jgi:hypothetical protein
MKADPALVGMGAVVLERKFDFQPNYFEQTIRVRILSQAGVAAAEFTDLPANLLSVEGQVTFPDGRVQTLDKREDFLVRKVVSTVDGTVNEGVLIPPGVTADCVLEVRWREATERGKAEFSRMPFQDKGNLPERCGDFWFWSLGSAYPTKVAVVQRSKEVWWPFLFFGTGGYDMIEGSGAMGSTYTFRDLPALPPAPYSIEMHRPVPKVLFYRPIDTVAHLVKAPATEYWQKVVDLYYKDYYLKFVSKGEAYRTFSADLRKDLVGGPREKARLIAERLAKRTVNLDRLFHDEKPDPLARNQMSMSGVSNLNYMAKTGWTDNSGIVKLLFHLLLDEGLQPKVALVADRRGWVVNPEVRTPFQFSHGMLGVEEPGQATLWLDPSGRLVPPGEIPHNYQGTKAMTIDSATWKVGFQEMRVAPFRTNERTYTYQVEVGEDGAAVRLEASFTGAPALLARNTLSEKAPTGREAWFKESLERGGFTVTKVEVGNALEPGKPLTCAATGTLALDLGRVLKINPFPGMTTGLYLPATLPEQRLDPILMPYLGIHTAESTIKVPPGYVLASPVTLARSSQWGTVTLDVRQEPGGDLRARMKASTLSFYNTPAAYASLKDYLQWVGSVVAPVITLERNAEAGR